MVKHTLTIRRLLKANCLSGLDHFVGLALKGLRFIRDQLINKINHNLTRIKISNISNSNYKQISEISSFLICVFFFRLNLDNCDNCCMIFPKVCDIFYKIRHYQEGTLAQVFCFELWERIKSTFLLKTSG